MIGFYFYCSHFADCKYSCFTMLHQLLGAGVAQSVWRLGHGLDDLGSFPGRIIGGTFIFATASRPALGPIQLHV
jgi:hypothetical protein